MICHKDSLDIEIQCTLDPVIYHHESWLIFGIETWSFDLFVFNDKKKMEIWIFMYFVVEKIVRLIFFLHFYEFWSPTKSQFCLHKIVSISGCRVIWPIDIPKAYYYQWDDVPGM